MRTNEGSALTSAMNIEPGEVHAVHLIREMSADGTPVGRVEVTRKIDEKGHSAPRKRHIKDVESFVAFVKKYGKGDESLVLYDTLSDANKGKAVVCLSEGIARGEREFGVFRPEVSPQWARWSQVLSKRLTQRELLDYIEDYAADIAGSVREIKATGEVVVAPGGAAALRTAIGTLVFGADITVQSTQMGEHDVLVSFQRKDKAESTRLPSEIALNIPVFLGEQPRTVVMRMKTNDPTRENGVLAFSLRCPAWQEYARTSWDEMMDRVKKALPDFHVLRGDFGQEPGGESGSY